jgi:hypothetical protein
MGEMKNVHTMLVGKPQEKVPAERLVLKHILNKWDMRM